MNTLANTTLARWFIAPLIYDTAEAQPPFEGLSPTAEGGLFLDQVEGRLQALEVEIPSVQRLAELIKTSSLFPEILPRFLQRLKAAREKNPRGYDTAILVSGLHAFGFPFLAQHTDIAKAAALVMEPPKSEMLRPDIEGHVAMMAVLGTTLPEVPDDLEALTDMIEATPRQRYWEEGALEEAQNGEWQRLRGTEKLLRMEETGDQKSKGALKNLDPNRIVGTALGTSSPLPWEKSLATVARLAIAGNPLAAGYLYRYGVQNAPSHKWMEALYAALYAEKSLFGETLAGFGTKPAAAYLFRDFQGFFGKSNNFWNRFLPVEPGLEEWFAAYESYMSRFRKEEAALYAELQAMAVQFQREGHRRDTDLFPAFQRLLWRAYRIIAGYPEIPDRFDPDILIG